MNLLDNDNSYNNYENKDMTTKKNTQFIYKLKNFGNSIKIDFSKILFSNKPSKDLIKFGKNLSNEKILKIENILENNKNSHLFFDYDYNDPKNSTGLSHITEITKLLNLSESVPVFKIPESIKIFDNKLEDDIIVNNICNNFGPKIINDNKNRNYIIQLWSIKTEIMCQIIYYLCCFYEESYLWRPMNINPFSECKYLVLIKKKINSLIELPKIPEQKYLTNFLPQNEKYETDMKYIFEIVNCLHNKIISDKYFYYEKFVEYDNMGNVILESIKKNKEKNKQKNKEKDETNNEINKNLQEIIDNSEYFCTEKDSIFKNRIRLIEYQ